MGGWSPSPLHRSACTAHHRLVVCRAPCPSHACIVPRLNYPSVAKRAAPPAPPAAREVSEADREWFYEAMKARMEDTAATMGSIAAALAEGPRAELDAGTVEVRSAWRKGTAAAAAAALCGRLAVRWAWPRRPLVALGAWCTFQGLDIGR